VNLVGAASLCVELIKCLELYRVTPLRQVNRVFPKNLHSSSWN